MARLKRPIRILALGVVLIALTALFFRIYRPGPARPSIVLISIDALRADYFTPEFMPKTHAWAKKNCAIFTNAYSNSTWTSPSHVTMLSGLLQSQHKVEYSDSVIAPDVRMVQQDLKEAGYNTFAFTGGGYLSKDFGFDRGFDGFADYWMFFKPDKGRHSFRELRDNCWRPVSRAEKMVSDLKGSHRLFFFIHTYFVHEYFLFNFGEEEYPSADRNVLHNSFVMSESAQTKRECYGKAVREMDGRLFMFIQALLHSALSPNLAIIITSDHGEGLGDRHGDYASFHHAHTPYSDQIHIPLIVLGIPKGEYDGLVGTKDIPYIIRSLVGIEKGSAIPSNDFIISEYVQYDRALPPEPRTLAITFPDKRILLNKEGKLFVFTDKADTVNVLSSDIKAMQGQLSDTVKDNLRALGYLN